MEFIKRVREDKKYFDYYICDCGKEFKFRSDQKRNDCGCKKLGPLGLVAKHHLYDRWNSMKKKARKESVIVSEEFQDFYKFVKWVGDRDVENLRLTRLDLSKEYSKENCDFVNRSKFDEIHGISKKMKNAFIKKYENKPSPIKGLKRKPEEQDKKRKTCLEKYGVDHVAKNKDVYNKIIETNIKRYGSPCYFQTDKSKESIKKSNLEKFGYEYRTQHPELKKPIIKAMLSSPNKNKNMGKEEGEVLNYIEELGFTAKKDFDNIVKMRELDIFIEEKSLAIEYCGVYWHNEKFRDKNYHYNKYKECLKKDIQLITIFSDEWNSRKIQVKNHLSSILGVNKKIFARKCNFIELDKDTALEFITNQHIQKLKKKPKYSFGLTYDGVLCSVMTFDLHPRISNVLTINRFCSLHNHTIVGGASKLFKNSLKYIDTDKIVSWSDNRWSNGNVYEKIGFKLEENMGPDYSYYNPKSGKSRIEKQKMKKDKIGCPKNITEKDFLLERGYYRIWDCGKKRWVYNV